MKSKTYSQSKQPLDKNERSEFFQSSVKQTHFQNLKKKRKWFFWSQGHFKEISIALFIVLNVICMIQISADIRRAICFNALLIIDILPLVAIWEMPMGTLTYSSQFRMLKKCSTKWDCLVYKMLYIRTIRPNLNTQSDSIIVCVAWRFLSNLRAIRIACRTGVIFWVFHKRGEREARVACVGRFAKKSRLSAYHCSSAPRHTLNDQPITVLEKQWWSRRVVGQIFHVKLSRSNGEITSLGLKIERKNTNQCLSALKMEY